MKLTYAAPKFGLLGPVLVGLLLAGCVQTEQSYTPRFEPQRPDQPVLVREQPRPVPDDPARPSDPYASGRSGHSPGPGVQQHAGIAQTARDGDIAVREEYDAAIRNGSPSALNLFIARHPDHPLAEQARRALQQ